LPEGWNLNALSVERHPKKLGSFTKTGTPNGVETVFRKRSGNPFQTLAPWANTRLKKMPEFCHCWLKRRELWLGRVE